MSPRPFKCRRLNSVVAADYYKPRGIPMSELQEIILEADEFEAVRLADLEGKYQADAAEEMGISRQTFGNIISSAHKKIADALINGKAIKIAGAEKTNGEGEATEYHPGNCRGKRFRGGCSN